ncbi:MAG: Mrp/NBP35 family ATP-binding protein [Chloroflexota bacterium]
MATVMVEQIREALRGVMDPELGRNLVELGMVRDVAAQDGQVILTLALTTLACPLRGSISEDARQATLAVEGVREVRVQLVEMTADERARAFGRVQKPAPLAESGNKVAHVIAVMSGKGGVGKSLVTGLLAIGLRRRGLRVGVLDADLTGPSIPKMFGLQGRPEAGKLGVLPVRSRSGIPIISINLFLEREDEAVIWRGPMVTSAIKQFWGDVEWGELDYMFVDLPPGTSDAPLTVMQSLPLAGAVIVSSPQDLAGMVVRKAARMAEQMSIPVIGAVENMSYFACPDNGQHYEVFGRSRADELAASLRAPLLGKLPIDPTAAELCDAGRIEDYRSPVVETLAESFLAAVPARARVIASGQG